MATITPFLWFDDNAEEAIALYTSLFENSRVLNVARGPDGRFFTGTFELNGRQYMALNGGPEFRFTEAFSLFVECETQAEVDRLWDALTEGGEESQCGWLKDRFGLSWQIIPRALMAMLSDADAARAARVREAMLQMGKIDVARLEAAARASS